MQLELSSGGWVALRDLDSLRARDQKRLMKSLDLDDVDGKDKIASGLDMTDALIALLVTDWCISYTRTVPVGDDPSETHEVPFVLPSEDISVIDDLKLPDYNALSGVAQDAMKVMFPKKPDPSDYDDPSSPSEPASE